jgi:phage terminase large subunit-like protein
MFDPRTTEGRRQIRNALWFWPRKSGKSTSAAGLGLYMTFADQIGGQVVVAANSRDQASLLFSTAADSWIARRSSGRGRYCRGRRSISATA